MLTDPPAPDLEPAASQQRAASPATVQDLISAVRSINHSPRHAVKVDGDDEPCYWQRGEWIDWLLELADEVEKSLPAR